MKLQSIEIRIAPSYHALAGQYIGEVKFTDSTGAVELILTPEQVREVLLSCADALVEKASLQASVLRSNIIDSIDVSKQLELAK